MRRLEAREMPTDNMVSDALSTDYLFYRKERSYLLPGQWPYTKIMTKS